LNGESLPAALVAGDIDLACMGAGGALQLIEQGVDMSVIFANTGAGSGSFVLGSKRMASLGGCGRMAANSCRTLSRKSRLSSHRAR
jgi:hypothetical protein